MVSSEPPDRHPDFEAEGLLEGLKGRPREGRRRLLERMFEAGVSLDELRQAVGEDRLVILPAEHALGSEVRYSSREASDKIGVPLDYLLAVRRAQGLVATDSDEPAYSGKDLEAMRIMADFYEAGFDREGMLEVARVLGRAMAQVADALGELFGQTFIKAGVTEEELGLRNAQAAREMLPRITPIFEYALRRHMRERLATRQSPRRRSKPASCLGRARPLSLSSTWSPSPASGSTCLRSRSGASPVASASSPPIAQTPLSGW